MTSHSKTTCRIDCVEIKSKDVCRECCVIQVAKINSKECLIKVLGENVTVEYCNCSLGKDHIVTIFDTPKDNDYLFYSIGVVVGFISGFLVCKYWEK